MAIRNTLIIVLLLGNALLARAETWVPLDDTDELREFLAGSSVEFTTLKGEKATASYNEDGTGSIKIGHTVFPRKWAVEGNSEACYSSDIENEIGCVIFEQNIDDATQYRATNTTTKAVILFRVVDAETIQLSHEAAAVAGGTLTTPSAAEIAAELSNPNTAMGTMNFFYDYTAFNGDAPDAGDANSSKIVFQPGMPYPITDTANLFVRPLVPVIIKQDTPADGGLDTVRWQLGDISYDVAVFNSSASGFIYGGGFAGSIPTATDEDAGIDQWLLGPEIILAVKKPWGVLGMFLSQQWDVAGDDDFDTSVTGGQYFYSLFMKDGWVFGANPVFSYNYEAESGNELTFPVGIGVSKLVILGGRPWKFGLQYWYYVESPDDFGPQHLLRFQVSPVIKLPW